MPVLHSSGEVSVVIVVDLEWLKSTKVAHCYTTDLHGTGGSPANARTGLSSRQCRKREKLGLVKIKRWSRGQF
jgi:hypothetical protein